MTLLRSCLLISALVLAVLPAAARAGVEMVEADGLLRREVYAAPSPTPGFCYWDKAESTDPVFHATNADGYGNIDCLDPWLVHCDSDSLVFRGEWPYMNFIYLTRTSYVVSLSCSVDITAETGLTAGRGVTGDLDIDEHTLTIDYPDGTSLPILQPGSGPDHAQLVLQPGSYRITLQVHALQSKISGGGFISPYAGHVLLKWENPGGVAVKSVSWSSLKAAFR